MPRKRLMPSTAEPCTVPVLMVIRGSGVMIVIVLPVRVDEFQAERVAHR